MIRSMTGYGRGECVESQRKFTVEIKSVNHRYKEISIRLPRMMNPLEDRLRKQLTREIQRGKVDVYVSMESFSDADARINVNLPLANAYVDGLQVLKDTFNIRQDISLTAVAGFPDVLSVVKTNEDDDTLQAIGVGMEKAAGLALDSFLSMREAEGRALRDDILVKLSHIEVLVEEIRMRSPAVAEEYQARLQAKLEDALANTPIDENRVLTEITIFVDRACIDEELTRLSSHLSQMRGMMDEKEAVGRKLDFLVQEINREINTIGSKSNDLTITKNVVALKSEVEKIREQVQNIE